MFAPPRNQNLSVGITPDRALWLLDALANPGIDNGEESRLELANGVDMVRRQTEYGPRWSLEGDQHRVMELSKGAVNQAADLLNELRAKDRGEVDVKGQDPDLYDDRVMSTD